MDYEHPTKLDRLMHAVAEHHPLCASARFTIQGLDVVLESNSAALITLLRAHYEPHATERAADDKSPIRVVLIEARSPDLELDFRNWPRDAHNGGHSEEYLDISGGRVVRDTKTRLQFLLGSDMSLVVGPCLDHRHQVLELVNASIMERLGTRGYLTCRGAAVARGEQAVIIVGPPRSGKSTLALQLLTQGLQLVAAERFMLQVAADHADIYGVPDAVRVNPGTLASSPVLASALPAIRRVQIDRLTTSDLWALEDKHWLDLETVYGRTVLQSSARLCGIVVLAWQPTHPASCNVTRKTWAERPGLVSWLAKRPGPLCRASMAVNRAAAVSYLATFDRQLESLAELPIWELTGRADFPRAAELCLELLA